MGISSRRRLLFSLIVPFLVLAGVPVVILFLAGPSSGGWAKEPPLSVIVSFAGLVLVVLHLFYIPLSEERGLENRFGQDYREYRRNVPRWIPRLTPWEPDTQEQDREQ
jgi:protein-S-isoprenylcysteine O-methyltransferase Ste14